MRSKIRNYIYINPLREKVNESVVAVLPIMMIVLILASTVAPVPNSIMLAFIFGGLMVIFGIALFSLGVDLSMQPIGTLLGSAITRTKKIWFILLMGFVLGALITISEPDLQVLADQVQSIPSNVLIYSVAGGVGLFLTLALVRVFFAIPLRSMLLISYSLVFLLVIFAPKSFLAVAFDSGGVTTGPMTVPFIMAFGVGISSFRNDESATDDSFGIVSLCAIGPIIAILILSIIFHPEDAAYAQALVPDITQTVELSHLFTVALPTYFNDIAKALLPIAVVFGIFDVLTIRVDIGSLLRILIGLFYTYFGLVVFLTGVNVGFMPAGSCLGSILAELPQKAVIIPVGMVMGYFIVKAEPSVAVLMHQVDEITSGSISSRTLQMTLSVGVSVSVGLALMRVLTGISVLWLIVPGYALALVMSFYTPPMFVGLAFDSGGVAAGPMTATFLMPFAMGACIALGGDVVTDAFGVVAMVSMTPLIAIEMLGLNYKRKTQSSGSVSAVPADVDNFAIIDL